MDIEMIRVTAPRLLKNGQPDPCSDPQNASTQYCQLRATGPQGPETPAEFNARLSGGPLEVTVTRGNSAPIIRRNSPDWFPLVLLAAVVGLLYLADR